MQNATTWFEIDTKNLARATAFYETGHTIRLENMGPSVGAVFAHDPAGGAGGALLCGLTAPESGAAGTLVYLDASPTLGAPLARAVVWQYFQSNPNVKRNYAADFEAHLRTDKVKIQIGING